MRIAFMTEYDCIGGGESNLMNLCEALGPHADVTLFCHGKLLEEASARGINCRELVVTGRRWIRFLPFVSYSSSLRRELEKFDVVHAYSLNMLPRLFLAGRPLVWTTHGFWERPYGMRAQVIKPFVKRVVTVSADVDANARFGAKQRKIYLGTPLGKAVPDSKTFDPGNVRIACVGRFQRIKGQDLLLHAARALAREKPDRNVTLDLVGDVNGDKPEDFAYRDELMAFASLLSEPNLCVQFHGFQKNPMEFVRAADFVAVPSRYESFSMVAIEALACGKPVVAPRIGGPLDIIDSTEIGQLFEPGSADALAHCLSRAIGEFSSFSPEACRRRASDFSVERQAEEHIRLYKEICSA